MAMSLDGLVTQPASYFRRTNDAFVLAEKAKLEIRTKAQGGEWVTLLDATVPNNRQWLTQVTVSAQEGEPTP
jgi:hypothetical protein